MKLNFQITAILLLNTPTIVKAHSSSPSPPPPPPPSGHETAEYDLRYNPIYNVSSIDIRCTRGGATAGKGVETVTVDTGTRIGFGVSPGTGMMEFGGKIPHAGPGQAYLSRLPDGVPDLDMYEGDGEWFKIGQYGARDEQIEMMQMNFTIPKTTPSGKYLIRVEHMFHRGDVHMQVYVSGAHIEVFGAGGGTPGPLVKFPGAYDPTDSSIALLPKHCQYSPRAKINLLNPKYVNPGPPVWSG